MNPKEEQAGGASTDPLAKYFTEIGKIPLMTPSQEVAAFQKVERTEADLLKAMLSNRPFARRAMKDLLEFAKAAEGEGDGLVAAAKDPSKDDFLFLMRAIRFSDPGREWYVRTYKAAVTASFQDELLKEWGARLIRLHREQHKIKSECVEANLRMAVQAARKYSRSMHNMTLGDLIQEANLGLIKAVERFDVARGYKFITYAMWWIRANLKRSIADKDALVRVPVHLSDNIKTVSRAEGQFASQVGRTPSIDEIASVTNLPVDKVGKAMEYRSKGATVSLDASFSFGEMEGTLLDATEDESHVPADEHIYIEQTVAEVGRMLTALSPRESQVIRWRFGFDDQDPLTLAEVGEKLGLSRERIRQVESKAIKKLQVRGVMREYR